MKKILFNVVPFVVSVLVWFFYEDGNSYSAITVICLLILQPVAFPGISLPFNIMAGSTMGWAYGFFFSYIGWVIGTCLTYWMYQIFDLTFKPRRQAEIKKLLEQRWWFVASLSVTPVLPIDSVARFVIATRIMSFSGLMRTMLITAPFSRFPPCFFGEIDYSNLFSPSMWSYHNSISIAIYIVYFAIGGVVTIKEWPYIKRIKDLFLRKEISNIV
jgi:uncharacterized membrane protein YdjX (TVP38/TMEM64 family)